tara:strand:- start:223 stop:333 length:111 start_codon:yes stop_codon:yes gene_type:complete
MKGYHPPKIAEGSKSSSSQDKLDTHRGTLKKLPKKT